MLCTGCSALASRISLSCECATDYLSSLSMEMVCHMLSYLPLRDIMKLDLLSHWLQQAVTLYLRLAVKINLTEDKIYGWMPSAFCDKTFARYVYYIYIYMYHHFIVHFSRSANEEYWSRCFYDRMSFLASTTCTKLANTVVQMCVHFFLKCLILRYLLCFSFYILIGF